MNFDLLGKLGGGAGEQEAQVDGETGHVHRKLAASAPAHLLKDDHWEKRRGESSFIR